MIIISCNNYKKVSTVSSEELIRIGIMDTCTAYLEYQILDKDNNCIDNAEVTLYTELGKLKGKSTCTKKIQSFKHFFSGNCYIIISKKGYVSRKIEGLKFGIGEMKALKVVLSLKD